jgi:hypothetical protein
MRRVVSPPRGGSLAVARASFAVSAVAAALAAGCSFESRSEAFECAGPADCEAGRVCVQGWCVVEGSVPDAGPPADAADGDGAVDPPDAGQPDAGVCGALAVDDQASQTGNNVSSVSWTHTTSGAAGRLLVVGVSLRQSGATTVSSVTYGGVSLGFVSADTAPGSMRTEIWQLADPPTGANTVAVTLTGNERVVAGSVGFVGADSAVRADSGAIGNDDAPAATVASAAGDLAMGVVGVAAGNIGIAPGGGQTARWNDSVGGGGVGAAGAGSTAPGAASATVNWSLTASGAWAASAVSVAPCPTM